MMLGQGGFIPIMDIMGAAAIIDDAIGGNPPGIPGKPMKGNPPMGGNPRAAGKVVVMGPLGDDAVLAFSFLDPLGDELFLSLGEALLEAPFLAGVSGNPMVSQVLASMARGDLPPVVGT